MASPYEILQKYIQQGLVLLNRYQIERPIGAGAYGSIYIAIDQTTHEYVAVKVLPPPAETTSRTAQDRFQREMKIISSLIHPNIISIYDYGETVHNIPFMVLEYLEGKTLDAQVTNNPMSLVDGLSTVRQIASALKSAHDLGIIHRDLKPANIMVMEDAHGFGVKVLDFGMAKMLSKLDDDSIVQLTREGVAVGTPRYIAPEQARGLEVGAWTDLYALGLLTYEIFTGHRAVKANTIEDAVMAHVSSDPLVLDEVHMVPKEVLPILHKLLRKNAKKRYQKAEYLIQDIEALEFKLRAPKNGFNAAVAASKPTTQRARAVELDYDKAAKADADAKNQYTGIVTQRSNRSVGSFGDPKEGTLVWVERILALVGAVFVYQFWTAQFFSEQSYFVRMLTSMVPYAIMTFVAVSLARNKRAVPFARIFLVGEVIMFLSAHASPKHLAIELIQNPAWFLRPYKDVDGLSILYKIWKTVGREYALIIYSFIN